MDQLLIISIATFGAVMLAVQALFWLHSERRQSLHAVNRRLSVGEQTGNAREAFEALRRERGLHTLDSERFKEVNRFLVQTGLRLNERRIGLVGFALSVVFFFIFGTVVGFGIEAFSMGLICCALALFLTGLILRRRRIARFSQQLPDAIDVIVRGVRAGYPFVVALSLVAKEMPDPIGTEFGLTSDEMSFGANIGSALENLYIRVGEDDLNYLTMAIKVQTETGGNLAEVLSRLSRLIRQRAMLRLKVRSISAEGRLSGVFLSLAPFVMLGMITLLKHDYYTGVANNPIIVPVAAVAAILLLVGNFWIYKMVNFKV